MIKNLPPVPHVSASAPAKRDWSKMLRTGQSKGGPRLLIIGQEGVGKSTFGADLPNPVFICAEDGLVGEQFDRTQSIALQTWEEVIDFARDFREMPFQWLVIDTIDWMETLLIEFICRRDGKSSIEDYGYGKGYTVEVDEFVRLLSALEGATKAGKGILFLAHSQVKNFKNPLGPDFDRYEGKANARVLAKAREWVDAVGFAHFEQFVDVSTRRAKGLGGENRVISWNHCAAWDAKQRYGMPDTMPLMAAEVLPYLESRKSAPQGAQELIAEITALIPSLPEEIRPKVQESVAATEDVHRLAVMLNRVNTIINQNGENHE